MFGAELAVLYGVGTKRLNEQISATDQDFQMISISVDRRGCSIFQTQFAISKRVAAVKIADTFMIPNGNNSIRSFCHRL